VIIIRGKAPQQNHTGLTCRPIIDYAKENMANEKVFSEVKTAVQKMKDYILEKE